MPASEFAGIGVQLWTLREQLKADYLETLADVAGAGYDGVELVEYRQPGVEVIRAELDRLGLVAIGAHVPTEVLGTELDAVIEELLGLGCEHLVVQEGVAADWVSRDSVANLAARLNDWGARAQASGLRLSYHGYHPIDSEFARLDGTTGYDLMVELTDPGLVGIQVDTYWVRHVGRDPAQTIRAYAGRVPSVHLKDAASTGEGDVPVGDGAIDWAAVLAAAAAAGAEWLIVEQEDDPGNAPRDIRRSLEAVRGGVAALSTEAGGGHGGV